MKDACNMRQFEEIKELQAKVDRLSARGIQDMQHSIKIYKATLRRIVALNDHTFQLQDAMEIARAGLLDGEA